MLFFDMNMGIELIIWTWCTVQCIYNRVLIQLGGSNRTLSFHQHAKILSELSKNESIRSYLSHADILRNWTVTMIKNVEQMSGNDTKKKQKCLKIIQNLGFFVRNFIFMTFWEFFDISGSIFWHFLFMNFMTFVLPKQKNREF